MVRVARYQAILPLRTENTESIATLVEGVPAGYQATDGLAKCSLPRPPEGGRKCCR